MLISAVLATANTVRNGKTVPTGKPGAPCRTTSIRMPVSPSKFWMSPTGSTITTDTATSM